MANGPIANGKTPFATPHSPFARGSDMTDAWPPLVFAGLGAFHGLNPAMGWLFAVALGLHRQSRTIVYAALVPIAPRAGI